MAKEHLLFDKTEIMAVVTFGNNAQIINLKYNNITSITIRPYEEKALFGKKPSEIIEIKVSGQSEPITYTKLKEKDFWEGYKTSLRKFAKDNKITFVDETQS